MDEERSASVIRRERFSGGPARSFLSSMNFDERLFTADLAVDRAHVVMLAEQEIIETEAASEILGALETVEQDGFDALPTAEDIHEAIETAVIDHVGPDGGKLHTARSRNDEIATCLRYRLREDLQTSLNATIELRTVLATLAADETATLIPGFTHLQPAQPTTLAHWALSYEGAIARDTVRLLDAFDRTNQSPLGAAAFAGTPYDIDRERTAELLGFDGIVENAMDATTARDFLVEAVAAHVGLATTLSQLAEDLILYAHRGFIELDADYASTSSIMPQKVNPDTLELVRATSGDAVGGLQGLLTTLKGLPRAYNRDLQGASPHAWSAIDPVVQATSVATGAIATAEWRRDRLETAASEGFSTATGVADQLAMAGLPFRTAHEIVATAATHGEEGDDVATQLAAIEAAAEEVVGNDDMKAHLDRDEIRAVLDPHESVRRRDSVGGPAPTAVETALETVHDDLRSHEAVIDERATTLAESHQMLQSEVDRRA